jgi:hypothetical protein
MKQYKANQKGTGKSWKDLPGRSELRRAQIRAIKSSRPLGKLSRTIIRRKQGRQ